MSDQTDMVTPDPTPEGTGGEAVATADSPWAFSPEREERWPYWSDVTRRVVFPAR